MADVAWPSDIKPRTATLRMAVNQRVFASPWGGSEQVADYANDRWLMSVELPVRRHSDAAAIEALLLGLRGMTRTVALWHFARPALRGTLTGSRTLATSAAQGASTISITAGSGHTLKAGDMLGLDGLLLMVREDCAESGGTITVPLVNRLRRAVVSGSPLTLAAPTADFRLTSEASVQHAASLAQVVALDFAEAVA